MQTKSDMIEGEIWYWCCQQNCTHQHQQAEVLRRRQILCAAPQTRWSE